MYSVAESNILCPTEPNYLVLTPANYNTNYVKRKLSTAIIMSKS